MKSFVCLLCAALLLATPLAAAASSEAPVSPKIMSQRTLNINNWTIYCTNYGPFVNPTQGGSGGFWGGTYNYIYGAGLWFAAVDSGNRKLVARGYDCGPGGSEFGPVNPYTEDWTNYLTDTLARVYLSTDPVDTSQWPLRSGGQPIILSEQDSYCKYSDQNPAFFWGPYPINIVVEQLSYSWNSGPNIDVVYYRFKVKNRNDYQLDSCYIGVGVDCDIGNEAGNAANDRSNYDWQRNLGFQFQSTSEPGWPITGTVGVRLLETPVNNMGYPVDIVDDNYPHTVPQNEPLGMTSFTIQTLSVSPTSEEDCYNGMAGYDFSTMILDAYDDWGPFDSGDKSFIISSGPFNLAAFDSVYLGIAVLAAVDTNLLKILSDSAQSFYNACIGVGGAPPAVAPVSELKAQCLPNPFRQLTTINYQITRPGLVSLRVYNIAGQLVKTLVHSSLSAGRYNTTWDGRDEQGQKVAAGVYLYQLQAGDRALTKKMVLIR